MNPMVLKAVGTLIEKTLLPMLKNAGIKFAARESIPASETEAVLTEFTRRLDQLGTSLGVMEIKIGDGTSIMLLAAHPASMKLAAEFCLRHEDDATRAAAA